MAKAKDLKAAAKELEKNYKTILEEAVVYATKKAYGDVYTKALSCLNEYYISYDPTSYKRHPEYLESAFVPYQDVIKTSDGIMSVVGIEYDPTRLDGLYQSGSEKYGAVKNKEGHITKYGQPDSSWIINNYLDGIHPTTNGFPKAVDTTAVEYYEITDLVSPTQKMNDYLEEYSSTFRDSVHSYLASYLLK